MVGNPKILSKTPLWYQLLMHFKESNCLVEGPIHSLKISMIKFPKPKKWGAKREQQPNTQEKDKVYNPSVQAQIDANSMYSQFSMPLIPTSQFSVESSQSSIAFSQSQESVLKISSDAGLLSSSLLSQQSFFSQDSHSQVFNQFDRLTQDAFNDDYKSQYDDFAYGMKSQDGFTEF